jgi:hypothetical protein
VSIFPRIFKRLKIGLLPLVCVFAALAAAILTVRAGEPGSSAADETGMGNSYEYPTPSRNLQPKAKPSPQMNQQAGTVAEPLAPTPSANSTANPAENPDGDRSTAPDQTSN